MTSQNIDEEKLNTAMPLRQGPVELQVEAGDPNKPRNWPKVSKWIVTLILSGFAFIQAFSETMLAPVQQPLSVDLAISKSYQWVLVNSLILIGVGVGPLVIDPVSELYGRRIAILSGSAVFILWNTCCGFAFTLNQMLAFRLLAGFGACTADAVAAPLLGPGVGPIAGAYISSAISWRWVLWITSIACATVFVIALFFLQETYEPRLAYLGRSQESQSSPEFSWSPYKQSTTVGSLNYISAAIGYIVGVQVAGHLNDKVYAKLKARGSDNKGCPEFRVPVMFIGTLLIPTGLLFGGWTGERHLHWGLPNIGCMIFTAGCYVCSSPVSVYVIDAYTKYGASAISTNLALRSIFSALFPLFAPYMFQAVGFGWGATILAGGFSIIGFVTMLVLWFFGARIRQKSNYCATDSA
ncbi:MFS general substrate transporter [Lentithecium fluviatile CBS 122367]|uniref:MFS general substrate transporter n=1 Tax=Lentithecium fluviatile CBS 122367 TaxID=1168545 RepID=A0A6G1IUF5_9PLEO|nr:MFS general substrate transporter [Lentithecium fluviatile CBS 122367]